MKVLITGAAGMVGAHCALHFARQGHEVIAYDNLQRSAILTGRKPILNNWNELRQYKAISLYKKDIRDTKSLDKCFEKHSPDVVIHAAGQPGVRFALEHPQEDFAINAQGTMNVLDALRRHNPKGTFIYCSTNKVYGDNVNAHALVEKAKRYAFKTINGIVESEKIDLTGHTPYGVSKLTGDLYVQDYARIYGLKTGVFRMSCIYGTRQFGFEDQGWVAWLTACHCFGKPIVIYGNGKQLRDVLWVEDLVEAFDKFIQSPHQHAVYNIGGSATNTMSLLELLGFLTEYTGKKPIVTFAQGRLFDQKVYVSDISKVKRDLKWKPVVAPKEGIKQLVQWIKKESKYFSSYF